MSDTEFHKEKGFQSYVVPVDDKGTVANPIEKTTAGDESFGKAFHSVDTCLADIGPVPEVFKHIEGGVDYRTVGWLRAAVIFLKVIFATGVLSIPSSYIALGAVGGAIEVICWGVINTCASMRKSFF